MAETPGAVQELVAIVQSRLTTIINAEQQLTALGPQFDVIDKREVLARLSNLASEALNAHNMLTSLLPDEVLPKDEWQPLATAPQDGSPFELQTSITVRWMPYKPNSLPRLKEGKEGRWQSLGANANGRMDGRWANIPPPLGKWRAL